MTRLEKMLSAIRLDKELLSESDKKLLQKHLKVFLLSDCCINNFDLTAMVPERVCPDMEDCHNCWYGEAEK